MKKRTLKIGAVGILLASGLCAQDLAGSWQGTLKGGSKDRRAVIEITKSETGEWKAVVHTDQTTEVLAADSVALDRSHIKIAIDPLDGDSGEAERLFRREAERHPGMIPNTIGA